MSLTGEIARLEAERAAKVEELSELETHGGYHSPILVLNPDDPGPIRVSYNKLPETELSAAKTRLKNEIGEIDAEIAELEEKREQKLSAGRRARPPEPARPRVEDLASVFRPLTENYRTIEYKARIYHLGPKAGPAIKILHEALKRGTPEMRQGRILRKIVTETGRECKSERLRDLFTKHKSAKPLWGALVIMVRPDVYRLDKEIVA